MSRIQDILSKAERDGTVRRTRALATSTRRGRRTRAAGARVRGFGTGARTLHDEARLAPRRRGAARGAGQPCAVPAAAGARPGDAGIAGRAARPVTPAMRRSKARRA